jgi:hypothetical protein
MGRLLQRLYRAHGLNGPDETQAMGFKVQGSRFRVQEIDEERRQH